MREERAWICEVAKLVPDAKCPVDSEFQKTSMMEIKRVAAEAGY
jgi:hypothetical protein